MGVFKKNGAWWIDFYHQGKRIRRKVGPSKKTAEMVLADIHVKQAKQEFLGVTERREIRFSDFADEYLAYSKANKARLSYERDVLTIRKHVLPRWGRLPVDRVTVKDLEDYNRERLAEVTPATVNRELNTVKNLFRKAVEWGYLAKSPAGSVSKIKTGTQPFRFLDEEEIPLLLDACAARDHADFYGIVLTALHTGMRKGEVLTLRREDVDLDRGFVRAVCRDGRHTKNYESRTVPVNRTLGEFLANHPRRVGSPYVFSGPNGKPFTKTNYHFSRAVRGAGIEHVRFHDLRHTFASHLVMKGVDLRTVQELLGHKDLRMTMKYAHLAPDHMKKAVEVLDAPEKDCRMEILDGHYLDTEGDQKENQDDARQRNILILQ